MFAVYIDGSLSVLRTDKIHILILQGFTCDGEQADNTKSPTLHLREIILTTEQCCRKLQMMHKRVSREAMLAVCKQIED